MLSLPVSDSCIPIFKDLDSCLLRDRSELRHRLRALQARQRSGAAIDHALLELRQAIANSQSHVAQRRAHTPAVSLPPELPITAHCEEISALLAHHAVIVLCGATGSGKSTQLPKMCLALGRGVFGRIGHTQPRRIAARSLALRISHELGCELGSTVGYQVRFQDRVRPDSQIKLMTDGILLAEIQSDRLLHDYDTLIIDEAHERSLNIDFLLGYLKQLLPRRPDLKLIITSATLDPERFSQQFNNAPILEVSGRSYPVEIRYRPPADENLSERDEGLQQALVTAVDELSAESPGDILVFLSGESAIRDATETLRKHRLPGTELLPLYARLGPNEQARIFQTHAARRIVLATNVAETSLTVPGIRYVIDAGFARISRYSPRSKVQRLPVERISQAAAQQRAGRCGRVAPGICIRLYSEDNFQARRLFTEPEIQRTHLAAVILRMRVLGFNDIEHFPFIDPPDVRQITDGYRLLAELSAVDESRQVTTLGRMIARLPLDPRLGRMVQAAIASHCLAEILIIVAALAIQDPRERSPEQRQAAEQIHATFRHENSDFLTLLNLWRFLARERAHQSKNQFRKLCERHFLSWQRVGDWQETWQQLRLLLHEQGYKENTVAADEATIHRALLSGLLSYIGFRDTQKDYLGAQGGRFWIHPGSGQFATAPKWIMAAERVQTTKDYGRMVAQIQPEWIESVGAHLLQRSYSEPHWQARRGQVAAFEKVSLYGLVLVAQRRVNYGPINPAEAREVFIRSALVDGDFTTRAPFFRHNQAILESVAQLEAKFRRRDLRVDTEALYTFYAQRIPPGIYCTPDFERWLRQTVRHTPKLLHLRLADALCQQPQELSTAQFPDTLEISGTQLPLEYRFDPGHPEDGVTLIAPLALINQIPPTRADWLVPGLLQARITALLRGLPKSLRKALIPIPEMTARLAQQLNPSEQPLTQALGIAIRELTGLYIPETAWDLSTLPTHLHMGLRLIDDTGTILATGRDFASLRHTHGAEARREFAQRAANPLERDDLTRWDFGALPECVSLERGGLVVQGYPALIDQQDRVALRILDAPEVAETATRAGLRRLAMLSLPTLIRALHKQLPGLAVMRMAYAIAPMPSPSAKPLDLADELVAMILEQACFADRPLPRHAEAFSLCLAQGQIQLPRITRELCTLVAGVLTRYQRLRKQLNGITQTLWQPSVTDMREQLDRLLYRGCLLTIPASRLSQYPRYLQALETRLERLPAAAVRDRERVTMLAPFLEAWQQRQASSVTSGRHDPRLEEIRWMLEELRISLFAQPQAVAYPVSLKRIEKRWRDLGL